jgi:hypothetical protein
MARPGQARQVWGLPESKWTDVRQKPHHPPRAETQRHSHVYDQLICLAREIVCSGRADVARSVL